MIESHNDEDLGPSDATIYINDGISRIMCRVEASINCGSLIFKNEQGEILASFDIVFSEYRCLHGRQLFVVDHINNEENQGSCLHFRRLLEDSTVPDCILVLKNALDIHILQFTIEFDIGFERDLMALTLRGVSQEQCNLLVQVKIDCSNDYVILASTATTKCLENNCYVHHGILRVEDRRHTSDYLWVLFSQLKKGRLREYDINNISRKRNPLLLPGFPGLRCTHCGGLENGNYFPTKKEHLYGCAMRFEKHLHSCKKCPPRLLRLLPTLKVRQ
jgi:hypothetical protein